MINIDERPLEVVVDDRPYRLCTFEAVLIRPRQLYALPAHGNAAGNAAMDHGSVLIKASAHLRQQAGLTELAPRVNVRGNSVVSPRAQSRDMIRGLLTELTSTDPRIANVEEAARVVFTTISGAILANSPSRVDPPAPIEGKLKALIEDANTLLFDDANAFRPVHDIANGYHVSERHLFASFRKATGLTPRAFYNMRRLEMAFAMLLDKKRRIADIAYELGFSAPPHFTRFMNTNTGWTPTRYRQMIDTTPPELRASLDHTVAFIQFAEAGIRRLE
ncbi:helix-turn-helix transcriptional regulator [Paraburkholderia sp. D1E]|uniref:helix-turn-helix transcriptional regulator n=1 Tax=Paraburkholderia sp. D1E TaxID=3461398 RepID=UPI004045F15A